MEKKIKRTEQGQSYFSGKAMYYDEYWQMVEECVPFSGIAKSYICELIRATSKLLHEYYNNGNINAYDESQKDKVNPFYNSFIKLLLTVGDEELTKYVNKVKEIIQANLYHDPFGRFAWYNAKWYEYMIDRLMWLIKNDKIEKRPIPKWYTRIHKD